MEIQEFKVLHAFCVSLFGEEKVTKKEFDNPEAIELTINIGEDRKMPVKIFELSIYRGDSPMSFMLIDDFRFELGADESAAITTMQRYLTAAKEKKLLIRGHSFLGIRFGERLEIEKPS